MSSWQKMRKELRSFLAPSLVNRVDYYATSYRHAHDGTGRVEIRVDGRPVTNFCELKQDLARSDARRQGVPFDAETHLDNVDFKHAAGWYLTSPVEESLAGVEAEDKGNPRRITPTTALIRRCLAVMDRRIGKRTLKRLEEEMRTAPDLLRYFYSLRCEAERIPVQVETPEDLVPDWRSSRA